MLYKGNKIVLFKDGKKVADLPAELQEAEKASKRGPASVKFGNSTIYWQDFQDYICFTGGADGSGGISCLVRKEHP